jgi:hypothetical protein
VRSLLDKATTGAADADLNACDERGWPPLAIAAQRGHARVVAFLLRRGASLLSTTEPAKNTAAHVAALFERVDVMLVLRQRADDLGVDIMNGVLNCDGESVADLRNRAESDRLRRESSQRQAKRKREEVDDAGCDSEEERWRDKLLGETFLVDSDTAAPRSWDDERADSRSKIDAMTDDAYAAFVRAQIFLRSQPQQPQQPQQPRQRPAARPAPTANVRRALPPPVAPKPNRAAQLADYEKRWEAFVARVAANGGQLRLRDIAWPHGAEPDQAGDASAMERRLLELFGEQQERASKATLRAQLLRWHPDKFAQRFGRVLDARDVDIAFDRVKLIAQCLTQLLERNAK